MGLQASESPVLEPCRSGKKRAASSTHADIGRDGKRPRRSPRLHNNKADETAPLGTPDNNRNVVSRWTAGAFGKSVPCKNPRRPVTRPPAPAAKQSTSRCIKGESLVMGNESVRTPQPNDLALIRKIGGEEDFRLVQLWSRLFFESEWFAVLFKDCYEFEIVDLSQYELQFVSKSSKYSNSTKSSKVSKFSKTSKDSLPSEENGSSSEDIKI